jgi:hypothetical protein
MTADISYPAFNKATTAALERLLAEFPMARVQAQIEADPSLFEQATREHVKHLAALADARANTRAARILTQVHTYLERCAELGVPQATAELADLSNPLLFAHEASEDLTDVMRNEAERYPHYHPVYYATLGNKYYQQYWNNNDRNALVRSIELLELGLKISPGESMLRPMYANILACALADRFDLTRDSELIDRSIALTRMAIDLTPSESLLQIRYQTTLGNRLRERFDFLGRTSDLDEAIQVLERPLARPESEQGEFVPLLCSNLARALADRYCQTRDETDLSRALRLSELAAAASQHGSLHEGLSNTYLLVYRSTGDLRALDHAIGSMRSTLQSAESGSPYRSQFLCRLGEAYLSRYVLKNQPEDLDLAISALAGASVQSTDAHQLLANALLLRYRVREVISDLDEALQHASAGVNQASHATMRARYSRTLALTHLDRFQARGDVSDLDTALQLATTALTESNGTMDASLHVLLAGIHVVRDMHGLDSASAGLATSHFRRSCAAAQHANPVEGLQCALSWFTRSVTRQTWPEVAEAGHIVLQFLRALFVQQSIRTDKETWLKQTRLVPIGTATALVQLGRLQDAVVALENGRTLLLSEGFDQRRLERALAADGLQDQARRYRAAVSRLHALDLEMTTSATSAPALDSSALKAAAEELRAAREAVLASGHLRHNSTELTFTDIAGAVDAVPLVYVFAGDHEGRALIVRRAGEVTTIPLPALRYDRVEHAARAFIQQYRQRTIRTGAFDDTTRWLWDAVIGPLVEAITPGENSPDGTDSVPSLNLIAAGRLSLMPLHAAWVEDSSPSGRVYALDQLCIRYLPNVRALRTSRSASPPRPGRFLGIENPTGDLAGASAEVRKVKTWFQLPRILQGDEVTRDAVLRELPDVDIAHFACHGYAHVTRPLDSALILTSGEKLTVADMLGADARLRLAVLSACTTGLAGDELPDELVSLSTGFLEAGADAVIASLWPVPDASTRELMTRFYALWLGSELHPAEALRRAQQDVRDSTLAEKERFAAEERGLPYRSARDVSSDQRTPDCTDQERPFADPRFWAAFTFMGAA